jgi:hypothetical protein
LLAVLLLALPEEPDSLPTTLSGGEGRALALLPDSTAGKRAVWGGGGKVKTIWLLLPNEAAAAVAEAVALGLGLPETTVLVFEAWLDDAEATSASKRSSAPTKMAEEDTALKTWDRPKVDDKRNIDVMADEEAEEEAGAAPSSHRELKISPWTQRNKSVAVANEISCRWGVDDENADADTEDTRAVETSETPLLPIMPAISTNSKLSALITILFTAEGVGPPKLEVTIAVSMIAAAATRSPMWSTK